MASSRFSVCQVCDIIAGDDGESEYMFPGSDDELEMGETGMGETGERVNYFDREVQGDSGEIDYLDRAQMDTSDEETDKGESNEESSEEEEDGDGGRTSTSHGVAGSSYGVLRPDRSRSRSRGCAQVRRGRGGCGGRGRRATMGERPAQTDREWTSLGGPVDVSPFVREVGPTFTVPEDPTSIFLALFTTELLDRVTAETNRFASTCLSASQQEGGSPSAWETTADEMKAFLGFLVLMGIQKLPGLYDYWSTDEVLHSFAIASRISRKRFLDLRRFLHFVDNDTVAARGEDGYDRLAKVRPVITAVKDSFLASYAPHCQCAIDEAMVRFKGRSSLKQYLPMKPTKRGFKVWVRADSSNGFVCDLDVYTGKDGAVTTNLGAKVVERLSRALVGGHYHLYFDNFFSSLPLFDSLLEDGLYACGTFRKDRKGIPTDIKSVKPGQ